MALIKPNEQYAKFKNLLLGVAALAIAVVISWYAPLLVLSDFDEHYPNGNASVCVTSTGEKYHLSSCSYLHSSSRTMSLERAVESGFGRCSRCDPPPYISTEEYQLAKAEQPLILLIIGIPLLCVPIALLSLMVIGPVYNFFGVFDTLPDWFAAMLICTTYIATLIQGFKTLIIW